MLNIHSFTQAHAALALECGTCYEREKYSGGTQRTTDDFDGHHEQRQQHMPLAVRPWITFDMHEGHWA